MKLLIIFFMSIRLIGASVELSHPLSEEGPVPDDSFKFYAHYYGKGSGASGNPCGATLVHDDILIGQASCCPKSCKLSMNSTVMGGGGRENAKVEKYVMHPGYNGKFGEDDIMAIKLKDVPNSTGPTGYTTEAISVHGEPLMAVGLMSNSTKLWQMALKYSDDCRYDIFPSRLCARKDMTSSACSSQNDDAGFDSGPLFTASGDIAALPRGGHNFCLTYTRISYYEEWIKNVICCMSSNKPSDCPEEACSIRGAIGSVRTCRGNKDHCPDYDDGPNCLSPDATVVVEPKGKVPARDLVVGDKVLTASGDYKTVFTISHYDTNERTTFLRVQTNNRNENPLELTPLHMLFLQGSEIPIPAKELKIGDFVQTLNGPQEVINVTAVTRNGFYNPVTTDGTIVVDGVITSTYTSLDGGSFLEIAGIKLVSFQSLLDMTISPYRTFCTVVSLDLCNRQGVHGGRPAVVHFMLWYYEFCSQQSVAGQIVGLLVYLALFGLTRMVLNPVGFFALCGMFCCFVSKQSKITKRISLNRT